MKMAFFETEGWEEKFIREKFPRAKLFFNPNRVDELNLPSENDFEIISVFIDSRLTPKVLAYFRRLKFIAARSTGYDHINLSWCKDKGVAVSYVPGYGDHTVAEFAFGLILNLTRKIYRAIDQIKEAESFSLQGLRGIDLKGKTLGIVGTGRIGREMIKIAQGFGLNVLASDPYQDQEFAQKMGFKYAQLEELLRNSDIISLHCPHTAKTHHLINKDNISLIKKGAFIVNTARGGIIDTEALIAGLKEGILAGAGLDVLEEEGEIKDELNLLSKAQLHQEKLKTTF